MPHLTSCVPLTWLIDTSCASSVVHTCLFMRALLSLACIAARDRGIVDNSNKRQRIPRSAGWGRGAQQHRRKAPQPPVLCLCHGPQDHSLRCPHKAMNLLMALLPITATPCRERSQRKGRTRPGDERRESHEEPRCVSPAALALSLSPPLTACRV